MYIYILYKLYIYCMNLPRCFFCSVSNLRLAMIRVVVCTCLLAPVVGVFCWVTDATGTPQVVLRTEAWPEDASYVF